MKDIRGMEIREKSCKTCKYVDLLEDVDEPCRTCDQSYNHWQPREDKMSKKNCRTCEHSICGFQSVCGRSFNCIKFSEWQPKEKEMRKPIEFENKDSFIEFITQYELCRTNSVSQIANILQRENYIIIKPNPVEEAEETYKEYDNKKLLSVVDVIHQYPFINDLIHKQHEAIQYLKTKPEEKND